MSYEHEINQAAEITVIGLLVTRIVAAHLRSAENPRSAFMELDAWSRSALRPVLAGQREELQVAIQDSLESRLLMIQEAAFGRGRL